MSERLIDGRLVEHDEYVPAQAGRVIVTRHPALIEYLIDIGIMGAEDAVVSHASIEDIAGKDVIGVLPLSLACHARSVTEVPLALTPEMRGQELTIDQVRSIAGHPTRYFVTR